MKKFLNYNQKGFTLVELLVVISIFVFMTGFLLAKYGTFSNDTILTNLAYDIALNIRQAQSYGLNVKSRGRDVSEFNYPYGVNFQEGTSAQCTRSVCNTRFIFFADLNNDGDYDTGEEISTTYIKNGSFISEVCTGTDTSCASPSGSNSKLDITFKRPDPNAIIKISNCGVNNVNCLYAEITVKSNSGSNRSIRTITVRSTGQISVK
jgi:prepilin-type N-terminal cleavage/methylation domain-containing protein